MTDENAVPSFNKGTFPSPLLPRAVINLKETGHAVASAIYFTSVYGTSSYYTIRNEQMASDRVFAAGKQPFQTYLDLLGVDGKQSFLNLDYHPRPVAVKFRQIMVNDIMGKMEAIDCSSLSLEVQGRKDRKKNEMAFKMEHGDFIKQVEQTSGLKFTDDQQFTPENEDELQLWAQLNDKEKEEMLMEEAIDFVMYKSDQQSIKKEIAEDLIDTGLGCEYTYFDGSKMIRCKRIRPEYTIYGTTNTLDFRNVPYIAHLERMSVVDVRAMYPDVTEDELYKMAYNNMGLYGNPNTLTDFIIDFNMAYTRPYDSFLVDVLFYEYKVIKTIDYTKGTDGNKNPIFDINKKYSGTNPNKKSYSVKIPTIYKGAWLVGSASTLEWGEMKNLIRSNVDVNEVRYSYSMYMLNNNGDMLPTSPIKMMRSSIINMDLAILRMQHVIATTPPNGMKMDLDAITEIDLGAGMGKVGPMKLREIWQQTGDIYYSSSKISGEQGNRNPIEQNLNQIGDKIQQYIGVYNFELNNIRDYIGVNEVKDGSGVNPRLGLGVMQGQVAASNLATAHIYGGYISIMTNTAKSIAIMLWDAIKNSATNPMYIKLLGQKNIDFIKYNKDLTNGYYTTRIAINMSMEDRQFLEQNIEVALSQGKIELEDALMVRKYAQTNIEYAIRYLSFMEKKRTQQAQRNQMQLAQQQQQATAQQSDSMMQAKIADTKAASDNDKEKEAQKTQSLHMLKIQDLINMAIVESMKSGAVIPPYVQALMDEQTNSRLNETELQIQRMEAEMELQDMQIEQEQEAEEMQQQKEQALAQQQDPNQQQGMPQQGMEAA